MFSGVLQWKTTFVDFRMPASLGNEILQIWIFSLRKECALEKANSLI